MLTRIRSSGLWPFLLHWLLVFILGRVVGFLVVGGVSNLLSDLISSIGQVNLSEKYPLLAVLNAAIVGLAFGAILGSLQRFMLRRKVHLGISWVFVTALSWAIGGVMYWVIWEYRCLQGFCETTIGLMDSVLYSFSGGFATGAILSGMTQWFILRSHVCKSALWVLTGIGEAILWYLITLDNGLFAIAWFILYVLLSGVLLSWLLGQPKVSIAPPNHSLEQTRDSAGFA